MARKNKGKFLLRIDDTDKERSRPEFEVAIKDDLRNFGLEWDGEFRQSTKTEHYESQVRKLEALGLIYDCFETPEDLDRLRKIAAKSRKPFIYNFELNQKLAHNHQKNGTPAYKRFKLSKNKAIEWHDLVKGGMSFDPKDLSDPVVARADGTFTYLLISVIDDIDAGISHVVRGEDHLSNSALQIQMFEALCTPSPDFAHLPLVIKRDEKISKRVGGFEVRSFLDKGLLPTAILNYLAHLGSVHPISGILTMEELIEEFDIKKFSKSSPNFDVSQIERLNTQIIRGMSIGEINPEMKKRDYSEIDSDQWHLISQNIDSFEDISIWHALLSDTKTTFDRAPNKDLVEVAIEELGAIDWDEEAWKNWTSRIKALGRFDSKSLFSDLRMALTGRPSGPQMSTLVFAVGKDRIKDILTHSLDAPGAD